MSRPLAAVLALAFPLAASAAPAKPGKPAPPRTSAADQQTFEQTFEYVLQQAGRSYLSGQPMPEAWRLDPFLENLKEPELSKAKANVARLKDLLAGAAAVQKGPGSFSPDVYKLMVDQAADDLEVGAQVEQEFVPNQRAGRSLDESERTLAAKCQGEARDQAYGRRSFYQLCLGRQRAEAVYLSAARPGSAGAPSDPASLRLLKEIAADKLKQSKISADLAERLRQTQEKLLADLPSGDAEAPTGPSKFQSLTARKPASVSAAAASDPFAQAKGLKTSEPPLNSADLDAGVKLARVAKADEIGFTGYCYSYVKSALQKVGIVDRNTIAEAGAAGRAKQFAGFVDKNPALLKRKLRRIPQPSWPLPIGTIVVWSAGACHYDAVSGHIEIVTRIKPPQACSDGCGTFQTACLDELASAPARAARALPQAQEDVRQAQTALDAAADRTSRRKAAAELSRKKAALASLQSKQEPAVAAYVIEREAPPAPPPGP